jgi:hypothetical protein
LERERRVSLRTIAAIVLVASALVSLGDATLPLWPSQTGLSSKELRTSRDLARAYSRIRPGVTHSSELAGYGFDSTSNGTRLLSYLGVMESFIPHDSNQFDRLDVAVQTCVAARERCTALIFQPADNRKAPGMFTAFGMGADAAAQTPRVTLLIRDGRVSFKMISGLTATTRGTDRGARVVPIPFRMNE